MRIRDDSRLAGLVPLLVGAVAATALWVALVPWDLSEVDSAGRPLPGGSDDHGGAIALVAVLVTGAGVVLAATQRAGWVAARFVGGGLAAWAALFAWRAGTAETSGANLFLAALFVVVLPVAVAIPLVVGKLSSVLGRRRSALGVGAYGSVFNRASTGSGTRPQCPTGAVDMIGRCARQSIYSVSETATTITNSPAAT